MSVLVRIGEREPVSPVQGTVRALRMCLAAAKSSLENRCVNLAEIDGGAGV